ncbi:MAG: XisH family protein [Bacteroidota bacterium]
MAKDLYHEQVKRALEKDDWIVTDDPYVLERGKIKYNVDLGAEKLLAASKGKIKILVEVKSFVSASDINEFHRAVGQYVDYLVVLEDVDPDRTLFLAVPDFAWEGFFQEEAIKKSIAFIKAKIIIYNPETETIASWIK